MPELLLSLTFLIPVDFLVYSRLNGPAVHALLFMAFLSFLGHKEWRFAIYVVPLLNVAVARGARAPPSPSVFCWDLSDCETCSISLPKGFCFCFAAFRLMLFTNSGHTLLYTNTTMENYLGASLLRDSTIATKTDNGIILPLKLLLPAYVGI